MYRAYVMAAACNIHNYYIEFICSLQRKCNMGLADDIWQYSSMGSSKQESAILENILA